MLVWVADYPRSLVESNHVPTPPSLLHWGQRHVGRWVHRTVRRLRANSREGRLPASRSKNSEAWRSFFELLDTYHSDDPSVIKNTVLHVTGATATTETHSMGLSETTCIRSIGMRREVRLSSASEECSKTSTTSNIKNRSRSKCVVIRSGTVTIAGSKPSTMILLMCFVSHIQSAFTQTNSTHSGWMTLLRHSTPRTQATQQLSTSVRTTRSLSSPALVNQQSIMLVLNSNGFRSTQCELPACNQHSLRTSIQANGFAACTRNEHGSATIAVTRRSSTLLTGCSNRTLTQCTLAIYPMCWNRTGHRRWTRRRTRSGAMDNLSNESHPLLVMLVFQWPKWVKLVRVVNALSAIQRMCGEIVTSFGAMSVG